MTPIVRLKFRLSECIVIFHLISESVEKHCNAH